MTQALHKIPANTKLKWLNGKPSRVGWYMASKDKDTRSWRWWDGVKWSLNVWSNRSATLAARRATKKASEQDHIQYTNYWPAHARSAARV